MASTLLQLVQGATGEMGLAVPTTVIGNTNQDVVQWLYLSKAAGLELCREHQWQKITKEYRFTTVYYTYTATVTSGSTTLSVLSSTTGLTTTPTYFMVNGTGIENDTYLVSVDAGTATAVMSQAATASGTAVSITFGQSMYAFPSDFDRQVDRTHYDKSQHWEMIGPQSAQQWQWLKSSFVTSGPRVRYRPLGGLFQIWPAPSTNDYLGFEYVSSNWVFAAADTVTPSKATFTVDTDTCIFHDRLMILAIKKKYFEIKGFDTTAFYRDYVSELSKAKAMEAGDQTLSMNPRVRSYLIGIENVPDSDFGP